jgi:hypothetical protein
MPSFISNADFLKNYDYRVVGQMCSDTGTPVSQADLATDPNLSQALLGAAGEILMACLKGGRYSEDDLNNLSDASQAYLQRLNSDLAWFYLATRRKESVEDFPQVEYAREMLKGIANGEMVFNVAAAIDAGHAETVPLSLQTIADQNYLVDAVKMFPIRRLTSDQF